MHQYPRPHGGRKPAAHNNPLRAELGGSTVCTAAGITARGAAPVLALCRQLLAAGLNPDQALEVYRSGVLALRVPSIGEAAGLEVNSHGTAFVALRKRRTASPIAPNDCPAAQDAETRCRPELGGRS
jgi:hypothetical protein